MHIDNRSPGCVFEAAHNNEDLLAAAACIKDTWVATEDECARAARRYSSWVTAERQAMTRESA